MNRLFLTILLTTLIGCTVHPAGATKGAGDLGQAQGLFAAGAANVDAAVSHSDAEGSALLKVAQQQFKLGQAWLAKGIADFDKLAKQNAELTQKLASERSHWIGYRTRMLGWWVTALAAVIAAVVVFTPLHLPIIPLFWALVSKLQSIIVGIWSFFKTLYSKIRGR